MSAPTPAIALCNVGKRYRRPVAGPRSTTLKGYIVRDVWRALKRRLAGAAAQTDAGPTPSAGAADAADAAGAAGTAGQAGAGAAGAAGAAAAADGAVWALRGINLTVAPGEVVGIVGPNGAGKSTLLKLLGNVVRPDEGTAVVRGRIAALIELGAGFHPELSGRENVLINGVILGLSRAEVRQRMQAIVDFAQVGAFIDYPVRTYSSGMYARLGFAVAIHVDPDVLLVDEVLSVGDAAFTRKCRAALEDFRRRGKSIVVVSHDLNTIATWCDRAVWLQGGALMGDGPAAELVAAYTGSLEPAAATISRR